MAKFNDITISNNEYRLCIANGKKALFHRWIEHKKPVPGGITPIDPPPGQISFTLGLVEYENGQVDEVDPRTIKFRDDKIKEYYFKEDQNNEKSK